MTLGKIVRINPDGSIPRDNPFTGRPPSPSPGRSGPTGIATSRRQRSTGNGQLWTVEHGARGGDELNNPQPGRNYGWPVITYGVDYSGARIGVGTSPAGYGAARLLLGPGDRPVRRGLLHGRGLPRLAGRPARGPPASSPVCLVRLRIADNRVVREERYLAELGARIRDVRQGPDGLI